MTLYASDLIQLSTQRIFLDSTPRQCPSTAKSERWRPRKKHPLWNSNLQQQ